MAQVVSCCVYDKTPPKYIAHVFQYWIQFVLHLSRSSCSSPSTKELHGCANQPTSQSTGCLPTTPLPINRATVYFFKTGQPQPLLMFIFGLFEQTSLQFLQQRVVKKCPLGIQCWDMNPQPSEHESPPINTRPGLPPWATVHYLQ